jgi:hypothetical protein
MIAASVLLLGGIILFILASQPAAPPSEAPNPSGSASGSASTEPAGPSTPPPPEVSALLDGLSLNEELVPGWRVHHFLRTNDPPVWWIELGSGEEWFSVSIGPKGTNKSPMPTQTEFYEVGYGLVRPKGARIPQEALTVATEKIAERIKRREKTARALF